nr:hypothetical protein [Tanacetum cinerariifolium]GEX13226.1 hypothetical protein [Tanacetum cinerariifolium]
MAKTINGEAQIHAWVDGKEIIITESFVRGDLLLAYEEGVDCLLNSIIFGNLELMGPKTTAWNEFSSTMASAIIYLATNQKFNFSKLIFDSMIRNLGNVSGKILMYPRLEAEQDSGNIIRTQSKATPNESSFQGTSSGGGPRCQEAIGDTIAQTRVPDLEKTKTTQALEITSLKIRVKKLEKKQRSRTHKLKRLYKVSLIARMDSSEDEQSLGKDASKQERKINDIDVDEDITLVNDQDDAEMFNVNDLHVEDTNTAKLIVDATQVSVVGEVNTTSIATTVSAAATITTEIKTLAQVLVKIKTLKPKAKGIVLQEPSESITTTTTISSKKSQDKGKAIMIEELVKPKKKVQLMIDEETTKNLQDEFDEEEIIAREKAEKELEANIALIEEWDDIQAKIDADYQLAQRLQTEEQEELTIEEKATLFKELLEKRRKHFAAKAIEEKRNKPPTQAQKKIMCTYLKNVEGKKLKDLKNKTELVEGSLKRVGEELTQESAKKQKVDDDKETVELKQLMKIIPDEEKVATDVIPLVVKSPKIVNWKIHKEGKKSYYQIIRADGKSKMYMKIKYGRSNMDKKYWNGSHMTLVEYTP